MATQQKQKSGGVIYELIHDIRWATFLPAGAVLLALVIWGGVNPEGFSSAIATAKAFILNNFSWMLALLMTGMVIFCFYVAFSKHGNIVIGGKDAKPTMSFFTWFAISLTAGIAIGILFWGVAEPLTFFHTPPTYLGVEGGTLDAAETSLKYVFFHWLITPYSCFVAAGIPLAYMCYNGKRKYKVSSALYPLIGDRCDGPIGTVIDALCIFGVVGGQTTSLGLGIMQLTGGITFVSGKEINSTWLYLITVLILEAICIAAACSGIHKAMAKISNINVYIYFIVLAFVFITGGAVLILNNTLTATGGYLSMLVEQSLYLEPFKQTGWVEGWSIFYWAWWVAPAHVLGLFLIKLAKGRTMRQFVVVNLFAPVLFSLIWFGIFGTAAINMDLNGAGIMDDINQYGAQVALFSFFQELPLSSIMIVLGFLACLFSVVTMHEAMILSLADSSSRKGFSMEDEQGSPTSVKVFWGCCIGAFACIMIVTGGLSAVQTSAVLTGVISVVLVTIMYIGFLKAVRNPKKYDLTLTEEEKVQLPH